MKFQLNKVLLLACLCFYNTSNGQERVDNLKKIKNGIAVVEINADFNSVNSVSFLPLLKDCKTYTIDLKNANNLEIKTVPTIIIFDLGKEIHRFEANIMMKCEATRNCVQKIVNEINLKKFQ
jgi:hypothetical protein